MHERCKSYSKAAVDEFGSEIEHEYRCAEHRLSVGHDTIDARSTHDLVDRHRAEVAPTACSNLVLLARGGVHARRNRPVGATGAR